MAGIRILDADDRREDRGVHIAFFKSKIRAFHFAVYQAQALAVAQRLGADDRAVVKGYVLAVPRQILSLDHAVSHHHVPGMPERVLGIEAAVVQGRVFDVLERIFSLEGYILQQARYSSIPSASKPAASRFRTRS